MFQEAMLDVLAGTETFIHRYTAYLESLLTPGDAVLSRLIQAMKQVPLEPARNFYEAYVACSMTMGLSGCFEPGRIDHYLWPYYEKDLAAGETSPEEALALLRALFADIDDGQGHPGVTHVTVGGTNADGSPCYNELTLLCVKAIAGLRTPNVTLRVRRDMPQWLWDAALENLAEPFWTICPLSNIFIHRQLPPLDMMRKNNLAICLGTDSLSSNHILSIVEEIKCLHKHFPHISLEEILTWACINGAKALGFESELGSFEVGKKPGIVLIENIDWNNFQLTENSNSRRLV
jgi:hypothetical protein